MTGILQHLATQYPTLYPFAAVGVSALTVGSCFLAIHYAVPTKGSDSFFSTSTLVLFFYLAVLFLLPLIILFPLFRS
jgi:hypothetical protein